MHLGLVTLLPELSQTENFAVKLCWYLGQERLQLSFSRVPLLLCFLCVDLNVLTPSPAKQVQVRWVLGGSGRNSRTNERGNEKNNSRKISSFCVLHVSEWACGCMHWVETACNVYIAQWGQANSTRCHSWWFSPLLSPSPPSSPLLPPSPPSSLLSSLPLSNPLPIRLQSARDATAAGREDLTTLEAPMDTDPPRCCRSRKSSRSNARK